MLKPRTLATALSMTVVACGGGGDGSHGIPPAAQVAVESPASIAASPIDNSLVAANGLIVSQLVDTIAEGVPYKSTSGAGSTFEGKTNSIGQFMAYPGGSTEFKIGNVNLGTWYEPSTGAGSIVQLPQLSYGQTACSSLNTTTTARVLLGLNSSPNSFHIRIPNSTSLLGCPQDANFFVQNNINITGAIADDHVETTATRVDVQKQIAALLFNIPISDVDSETGANYNYNNYGSAAEADTTCTGYAAGHAGVDFQTKDAAGSATADRDVYFLTDGEVLSTDSTNGRVIVSAVIPINGKNEDVKIGYLHLRSISVSKGDKVLRGAKLGVQGNKGLGLKESDTTTQEHVHVEVRAGTAPTGAACGASPKDKVGTLDPLEYFTAIVGGSTPKWVATMTNHNVGQRVEFESDLPEGSFSATGRETFVSGTCTLTSEMTITGNKTGRAIKLKTSTTTSYKTCPDGVHTATQGFIRNYVGDYTGTAITITSVDQCDFSWSNPSGCFKFGSFIKEQKSD